jgi:ATP/maltotriose-dependent transcriptional regulator MalT
MCSFKFFSSLALYYVVRMTMSFLLHDSLSEIESTEITSGNRVNRGKGKTSPRSRVTVIEEKLRIPSVGRIVSRSRLLNLLEQSIDHYGATLISGRAGTGKTTLAADFASGRSNVSWLSIEPSDSAWREFSASFAASVLGPERSRASAAATEPSEAAMSEYLTSCFSKIRKKRTSSPRVIVLDNVHHLFDAEWFAVFFKMLVTSLDDRAKLLMLCRSKPNAPLWRLRSKQMLNVIDETLLDLTSEEAREICALSGVEDSVADGALRRSFGRISTFLRAIKQTPA